MSTSHQATPAGGKPQEDMQLVAELKVIWCQYQTHPRVRAALIAALTDGQVSPGELLNIRVSIGMAMANEIGGWEAFVASGPDPRLLAEIQQARDRFPSDSEPATTLDEILKDGAITPNELATLRAVVNQARIAQAMGPQTHVRMPRPPRPNMPGKIPSSSQEDEES